MTSTAPGDVAALLRRRTAAFLIMFCYGLAFASWVSRTPNVRDLLHASTLEMGAVLFGLSVGSMVGVLPSGRIVGRFGSRRTVLVGGMLLGAGTLIAGLGSLLASMPAVAVGLALLGLGFGTSEVAVNVEGADIEARLGRSTLPTIHGFFSLGSLIGAVAGIAMTAWAVPVVLHLGVVAALEIAAVLFAFRRIPSEVGRHAPVEHEHVGARRGVWRDPMLVLIGVVILSLALAEGSANDWLPLVMVDGHGLAPAEGSATFTVFALAMTLGRLVGGRAVDRIGAPAALGLSAAVSAVGIAGVTLVDAVPVAVVGAAVWGLGAALGFPVALSLAAKSGPRAQARMSFAVTMGYTAFLVGPPVLGVLGDHVGLRGALLVVLGLALIAVLAAIGIDRMLRARGATPVVEPGAQPIAER